MIAKIKRVTCGKVRFKAEFQLKCSVGEENFCELLEKKTEKIEREKKRKKEKEKNKGMNFIDLVLS